MESRDGPGPYEISRAIGPAESGLGDGNSGISCPGQPHAEGDGVTGGTGITGNEKLPGYVPSAAGPPSRVHRTAQDRPDRAGIEAHQAQGQGDQFVAARGDMVQDQPFQDGHVVGQTALVDRQILG
jgi:hypothetical protein